MLFSDTVETWKRSSSSHRHGELQDVLTKAKVSGRMGYESDIRQIWLRRPGLHQQDTAVRSTYTITRLCEEP